MKILFNLNINFSYFVLLLFLSFVSLSLEDIINVDVKAKTGIINKKLNKNVDSTKTKFSFEIECEVNKNISNNMTNISITIQVKKIEDSNSKDALCNLVPVRVYEAGTAITTLYCLITGPSFREEDFLIIANVPTQEDSNVAEFNFQDFNAIDSNINIRGLTLEYLDENYCKNNYFLFKMSSDEITVKPLLSTICNIGLDGDEDHPIARCAIPLIGTTIICNVDVSNKKYKENDKISIKSQSNVPCENGQLIKIEQDATNELKIQKDCGEIVNNNMKYLYSNYLFLQILFCFLI